VFHNPSSPHVERHLFPE
jgi:hypothetical protein